MGAGLQGDNSLQGGQQGGDPRDGGGGEEEGREDEEEGAAPVREAQGDGRKDPKAKTPAGQPVRDSQLRRGSDGRGLREHREVRGRREGGRGGDGQADKPLLATRGRHPERHPDAEGNKGKVRLMGRRSPAPLDSGRDRKGSRDALIERSD